MTELSTTDQNPTAPRPASSASGTPDTGVIPRFADVPAGRKRTRFAVVGAGHRAGMYVSAIMGPHADVAELVAWCDTNPGRMSFYDAEAGEALPQYGPDGLERMIAEQRVEAVIITTPDFTHADLVTRAQTAGVDVVVEKPLATTAEGCRAIIDSVAATGRDLTMTFNYRYAPRNSTLREVIASGAIGTPTSVHFEWVLDTLHGADYFRRWHRQQRNSGSLLIHKAAHHFDLVNWWLDDVPARVFASAGLQFYGDVNAAARGMGERPERGTGVHGDPWALDLSAEPRLKALYLDSEHHDGYLRDRDVFTAGIDIHDNMSLVVDYRSGARMSYSLNAHAPWEGYNVAINGTEGRAELSVVERGEVLIGPGGDVVLDASAMEDGAGGTTSRPEGERLVVQRHWGPAEEIPIPAGIGGHGGGDAILLMDVFRRDLRLAEDPLGRAAGYRDGVRAVAVGIAANQSLATGKPVLIEDLGLEQPAAPHKEWPVRIDSSQPDRLVLSAADTVLAEYIYRPTEPQVESPRPYALLRSLDGSDVTAYRPDDHVWHKGLSLALPVVGPHNFWGGPTYVHGDGYVQLPNNGAQVHRAFIDTDVSDDVARIVEELDWIAEDGAAVLTERRTLTARVVDDTAWALTWRSVLHNVAGVPLSFGSPTSKGRENAGYCGIFWRGPVSFTGGQILSPAGVAGDAARGEPGEWLAFIAPEGQSGVLMLDGASQPWFARSEEYAGLNPAPFFFTETVVHPGEQLTLSAALIIGDAAVADLAATTGAELVAELRATQPSPESEAPA